MNTLQEKTSFKHKAIRLAVLAAFGTAGMVGSAPSFAAGDKALAQIRAEMQQMRTAYEARMQALEQKLQAAINQNAQLQGKLDDTAAKTNSNTEGLAKVGAVAQTASEVATQAAAPKAKASAANAFNPAIALNLTGTFANLSKDPDSYFIQGFMPTGGEIGPGKRGFGLGETELTFSANIDPKFFGELTFALAPEGGAEVEEAFVETRDLGNGMKVKVGRMLSGVGYMNSRHAHTWDFVDAPLAYQAMFGGRSTREGVQMKWLAPLDRFFEVGVELGNGGSFPGTDRNKNGFADSAIFAHVGDDIGSKGSWLIGASYMRNKAKEHSYEDTDGISGATVANSFNGRSTTWIIDGVFKWAPTGNSKESNFSLIGEYMQRKNNGSLSYAAPEAEALSGSYSQRQSGWYLQGVYQFKPQWRMGVRHERLSSGTAQLGLVNDGQLTAESFPLLASYNPRKTSLMFDYLPSEFSRWRLQFGRDQSQPGRTDHQIYLQYNMSLGAHSAHTF